MTKTLIIVLGNENSEFGVLSETSTLRVCKVIEVLQRDPASDFLCTGAYGEGFNRSSTPHGRLMAEAIAAGGISMSRCAGVTNSSNTVEDAVACAAYASRYDRFVIITSAFHLERAKYLFNRILIGKMIEFEVADPANDGLPAKIAHEQKLLADLKRGLRLERIDFARCDHGTLQYLANELQHYDKISYYPLVGAVAATSFGYSLVRSGIVIELVRDVALTLFIGVMAYLYVRFANTARVFREEMSLVAFAIGQPTITTSVQVATPLIRLRFLRPVIVIPAVILFNWLVIVAYRVASMLAG